MGTARNRTLSRLKAKDLATLPVGIHQDGGGLRFRVVGDSRSWVLRLTLSGRSYTRGLGPYPLVSLDMAREQAIDHRCAAREGRDLAREKRLEAAKATSVRQAFKAYFHMKEQQLANAKHKAQWSTTMGTYVFSAIGGMSVGRRD
jgi:Arm DNA-binding domain